LYTVRSESQLVERIATDLLFRWFLDMDPAEPAFDATAFTHNRPRLDQSGITAAFFGGTVRRIQKEKLASEDHFSVDGTLIEAYASLKSFVPKEEIGQKDSSGLHLILAPPSPGIQSNSIYTSFAAWGVDRF
jgi:transposase